MACFPFCCALLLAVRGAGAGWVVLELLLAVLMKPNKQNKNQTKFGCRGCRCCAAIQSIFTWLLCLLAFAWPPSRFNPFYLVSLAFKSCSDSSVGDLVVYGDSHDIDFDQSRRGAIKHKPTFECSCLLHYICVCMDVSCPTYMLLGG